MVINVLDESKNGLISQKELKEAVRKVAEENEIEIDDQELIELVEAVYTT